MHRRGIVEVTEVTRGGIARFMAGRVLALIEHPAGTADGAPQQPRSS